MFSHILGYHATFADAKLNMFTTLLVLTDSELEETAQYYIDFTVV